MRALTLGLPLWSTPLPVLDEAIAEHLAVVDGELSRRGLTLRTTRFTLPVVPPHLEQQPGALTSALRAVQELASRRGARWYCLPVDLVDDASHAPLLSEVLDALVRDQRLFVNLLVADGARISVRGARAAAELVLALARRSQSGFDTFRVGISSGSRANTPFFPFSRHEGDDPIATIALETTAPLVRALRALPPRSPIDVLQRRVGEVLRERLALVDGFGRAIETARVRYGGLDASYAPFPEPDSSVGALVECFGVAPVGAPGTLFVTSLLTDALRAALDDSGARAVGFNGVMYSVLEDPRLASANNLAQLSLEKLMLFSTLCGCGLDMAPIPATAYAEDVTATILDVAALAVRLGKPLGVRLVPIPGKQVNELASFGLDFLCDSRIMSLGPSETTVGRDGPALWRYVTHRGGVPHG